MIREVKIYYTCKKSKETLKKCNMFSEPGVVVMDFCKFSAKEKTIIVDSDSVKIFTNSENKKQNGIFVDLKKEILKRTRNTKKNPLLQSVGRNKVIYDGTAGYGVDAITLAMFNKTVFAFEKNRLLYLLLKINLTLLDNGAVKKIILKNKDITGVPGDKQSTLYIDPMYKSNNKKALPKGRMQFLRKHLVTNEQETNHLVEHGIKLFNKTVLKRPIKAPILNKPSGSIRTKNVRYDIYPGL